jgi:O-antigen ligase
LTVESLAQTGGVVAALGVAALILGRQPSVRLAGVGVCGGGLALFIPLLAPTDHRPLLAAAGLFALAVVCGLAVLFVRYPWALAFVTLAAAPARIPVTIGETTANLLVPLYAVIAAAAIALGWRIWREPQHARELGPLAWPVALLVVWFGISALWTEDVRNGAIELFFYIIPFSVLAVALARLRWSPLHARWLQAQLVAMAAVFATIGIWQWVFHGVFWNEKVIASNVYESFYRVNSLFWDPSVYGRFLVLAILASVAVLLFSPRRGPRRDVAIVALIVLLWVGLVVSFSQSSFLALAAALCLAAFVAWRWRALLALAVAAAVMIPAGIAAPQLDDVRDGLTNASPTQLTSHRSRLVSGGVRIALDHPVVGVGVGGFSRAYEKEQARPGRTSASHTTPVTVAAETGIVGLLLYAWLLAAAIWLAFRRLDVSSTAGRAQVIAGIGIVAISVHSLFYSAFFEDPLTWGFVALAVVVSRARGLQSPESGNASGGDSREGPKDSVPRL